jgi:aerobic-type carbon monoxide dehydrogenase small subunit (CoxS/CutS family)
VETKSSSVLVLSRGKRASSEPDKELVLLHGLEGRKLLLGEDAMTSKYALRINGQSFSVDADADTSLLSVLREQLDLTGTKYGCGEGQCGACTVLIDGRAQRSCLTPVSTVSGKSITTIEGLAKDDRLHPVQQAFLDEGAMQCAYCTSGMIMSAVSLLNNKHNPSGADILKFMQGNICRCGTYPRIVSAVRKASAAGKEPRP